MTPLLEKSRQQPATAPDESPADVLNQRLLLIGDNNLFGAVAKHLTRWDIPVSGVDTPDDDALSTALAAGWFPRPRTTFTIGDRPHAVIGDQRTAL
ncbi:MAG: hypothetical protein ACRDQ7_06490 [Haloechinothrix sp.]